MQKQLPTPYNKPRHKKQKEEPEVSNIGEEYTPKSIEEKLASISAQLSTIMETQATHSAWFVQLEAELLAAANKVPDTQAEQLAQTETRFTEREEMANTYRLFYESEHRKKYLQILIENIKNNVH